MKKRSVLFDTETTGVNPDNGDRIIEIAAIELVNDLPTDNFYHVLIDPERDIPVEATRIHGFTIEVQHYYWTEWLIPYKLPALDIHPRQIAWMHYVDGFQ